MLSKKERHSGVRSSQHNSYEGVGSNLTSPETRTPGASSSFQVVCAQQTLTYGISCPKWPKLSTQSGHFNCLVSSSLHNPMHTILYKQYCHHTQALWFTTDWIHHYLLYSTTAHQPCWGTVCWPLWTAGLNSVHSKNMEFIKLMECFFWMNFKLLQSWIITYFRSRLLGVFFFDE